MAEQLIFETTGLITPSNTDIHQNQTNKFRIKMVDDTEMTDNNEGFYIRQAIANNATLEISPVFRYSLGLGIPNFDYSLLANELEDKHPDDVKNFGGGIFATRNTNFLPYYGNIATFENNVILEVERVYWEIENFSCIVEVLISLNNNGGTLTVNSFGNFIKANQGVHNLNEFGFEAGDAPFIQDKSEQYLRSIPKEDIPYNILISTFFSITLNQSLLFIHPITDSVINSFDIESNQFPFSNYVPVTFSDFVPNLRVVIEDLNYPDFVLEGDSMPIFLKLKSQNYRGKVQIYLIDKIGFEQNLYNEVQDLIPNFGNGLGSQYGELSFENTTNRYLEINITDNEEVNIPITYTPNSVFTQQSDTAAFFILAHDIDFTQYNDYINEFEAQEVYFNETIQNHIIYKDNIKIDIINNEDEYFDTYYPSDTLIEKPTDVIHHLMFEELNIDINNVDLESKNIVKKEHQNWKLAFSQNKKISAKSLIANLANSTKFFPILNNDVLKFLNLKSTYRGGSQFYQDGTIENILTIKESEILEYNFSKTSINNIVTELDFKYNKDYGLNNYKNSVHLLVNQDEYFINGSYENILANNIEINNYYGVKTNPQTNEIVHNKTRKIVENDYVRDEYTSQLLAEYIFEYYKNQHNLVKLKLPLKYYNYEVGDIFEFDKMILGRKLYNEHYVINDIEDMPIRCGQFILPLFIVTETQKKLDSITIKGEQLHHLSSSPLNWKGQEISLQPPQDSDVPEILLGDVNNDGSVDVLDIVAIVGHVIGENTLSAEQVNIADTNQDGFVDVLDVVEIISRIINEEN